MLPPPHPLILFLIFKYNPLLLTPQKVYLAEPPAFFTDILKTILRVSSHVHAS